MTKKIEKKGCNSLLIVSEMRSVIILCIDLSQEGARWESSVRVVDASL